MRQNNWTSEELESHLDNNRILLEYPFYNMFYDDVLKLLMLMRIETSNYIYIQKYVLNKNNRLSFL